MKVYGLGDNHEMTPEERRNVYLKKYGCGMSLTRLKNLIKLHKNGNEEDKQFVEKLLTCINFHDECSAISKGEYEDALEKMRRQVYVFLTEKSLNKRRTKNEKG